MNNKQPIFKVVLFLCILLVSSVTCFAKKTIQMEKEGGVYKIPCFVNGVKMKFIFDTGAASVCISKTMAEYLIENEYLSKEDILGKGTSSVADGRSVDHVFINIKDIEIEGMHLKNVKAVIIDGQKAPLLLGQTAIQKLGRISIDGDMLTIYNIDNEYNQEEIGKLLEQAKKYIDKKSYSAAIECLTKVENNWGLSEIGLRKLAFCYFSNDQYNECLLFCKKWIEDYDSTSDNDFRKHIYNYVASSYDHGLKDYNNAILWYQKEIAHSDEFKDVEQIVYDKFSIACCYNGLKNYYKAKELFKIVINDECNRLGIKISEVGNNKINEEILAGMLYGYGISCNKLKEEDNLNELMILSAKCGLELAITFCKGNKLNYNQTSNLILNEKLFIKK